MISWCGHANLLEQSRGHSQRPDAKLWVQCAVKKPSGDQSPPPGERSPARARRGLRVGLDLGSEAQSRFDIQDRARQHDPRPGEPDVRERARSLLGQPVRVFSSLECVENRLRFAGPLLFGQQVGAG